MEKIRAVFFDIDGTIQTFGNPPQIPESTRLAMDLLRKNGIKLFIATGRPPSALTEFVENSNLTFDGWVTMNGQYVYADDKIVREVTIPKAQVSGTLDYLEEKGIFANVASLEAIMSNSDVFPEMAYVNRKYSKEEILSHNIYQLMVYIEEGDPREKEFFDVLTSCKSARWHPIFMDVIPKDGGKNKGIDAMLEYFGIPLEESMAFGDGGNDMGMLEHVHLGIAMGNARDYVKEVADYVTTDIDDDGIYNACKHFGII